MKKIVLVFTGFYLPGFKGGGPIRTISNMVDQLSDDIKFLIVTRDRDLGDDTSYHNVNLNQWNEQGKASVLYCGFGFMINGGLLKLLRDTAYDIVYLNSFFSPFFTIIPLFLIKFGFLKSTPVVLAPRGEFSAGALAINKSKKFFYIWFARLFGLYRDVRWHASTEDEVNDIVGVMFVDRKNVFEARNLSVVPEVVNVNCLRQRQFSSIDKFLKICFLSRISPKKNLDFALEVLHRVRVPVEFNVYGPIEDMDYWSKCEILIKSLPVNVKFNYHGPIDNPNVRSAIEANDIFFVPTRGENFGHVYIESLSSGVPILLSDQTPWRDLISKNIGWDIGLDSQSEFVRVIDEYYLLDSSIRLEMRASCLSFIQKISSDDSVVSMNKKIFLDRFDVITL